MTDWQNVASIVIAAALIILLFLIIWSKIMGQTILDTVVEIKEIIKNIGK